MRTDRSGCFDRTLEARSWTQTETLMRFPMSTTSRKNSPRPEGSLSCGAGAVGAAGFSGSAPGARDWVPAASASAAFFSAATFSAASAALDHGRMDGAKRQMEAAVRGSAAKMTPSASTTATSSSCEMPDSLAPSSSSRAIANEMVNARSLPRPARALEASLIAVETKAHYLRARVADRKEISAALAEGGRIHAPLAWQGGASLLLRRLLVAPRGVAAARAASAGGAPPPRNACAGAIFGCTLGNLAHFVNAHRGAVALRGALRTLHATLGPVAAAVPTITGNDAAHLGRALACHCVLRSQARRMPELRAARLDTRRAHPGVALGAAAALLVAYTLLGADDADLERHGALNDAGLGGELLRAVDAAVVALSTWRLPGDAPADVRRARDAERRALDRAGCALRYMHHRAAVAAGDAAPLEGAAPAGPPDPAPVAYRRQLHAYRAAVWPAGAHIASDTNGALLERIVTGRLFDAPDAWRELLSSWETAPHPEVGVVPLSALPSAHALARAADDDDDDASCGCSASVPSTPSASSHASGSSWGSAGSVASVASYASWGGAPAPSSSGALLDDLRAFHLVDAPDAQVRVLSDDDDDAAADGILDPADPEAGPPIRWL